jgi:pimeloyl-ACP methyl ester carboxylesterase
MEIPIMDGVTAETIGSERIRTRVLFSGAEDGVPVLFLHGNVSSATWWEDTLISLPDGYRGIAPDQRGFGESDPDAKIDATRGMGDLAEDALALLDTLGYERAHIVGNSLGGMVVWHLLTIASERFLTATLADPGSPFGFGATRDVDGTPTNPDFAGSGGGLSNPELIRLMKEGEMSAENQFSPRAALRTLLVKPPFIPKREDALVMSMLSTHLGEQDIPGDAAQSIHWPHMAPGVWGATNATSPKYAGDIEKIIQCDPKPDILWVRGSDDLVVSDTAASDPGYLGQVGLLPGWPGEDEYPPQPMIGQIHNTLEKYAAAGGSYKEVIIEDAGHVPFIEKPDEFNQVFHPHIGKVEV